jgi:alpha-1,3-rhamnosyltransferase
MTDIINQPLVSIVVPCYNHERFIKECIESIVNQTYKNIELTIIDDGSKDNSPKILKELQAKYGFNIVFQENHGVAYTLNRGLKEFSKGKYFACCASDDFWALDKIEKQVKKFEKNLELGLIFSKAYMVDKTGTIIDELPKHKITECSFNTLIMYPYIPALTVMVKRNVFEEVGLFDPNNYIEDWDMWLRIANVFPFEYIDEFLAYNRIHGKNMSFNYLKMIESQKAIINKWKHHPIYQKAYNNVLLYEIAILSVIEKKEAIRQMLKHIRLIRKISYWKSIIKLVIKTKL